MSEKIKGLAVQNTPSWLLDLTKQEIESDAIPVTQLLDGSVYYPCCGLDGGVILDLEQHFQSFVYVDYGVNESVVLADLPKFEKGGYSLVGQRRLKKEDLSRENFTYYAEPSAREKSYMSSRMRTVDSTFGIWCVFARQAGKTDSHGPERFSLLYICGDGAATYQALYGGFKTSPAVICIIQTDGFSGNYAEFREVGNIMHRSVTENKYGNPKYLLYGGYGWTHETRERYKIPCWPEFNNEIWKKQPYYADNTGVVTLFKKAEKNRLKHNI